MLYLDSWSRIFVKYHFSTWTAGTLGNKVGPQKSQASYRHEASVRHLSDPYMLQVTTFIEGRSTIKSSPPILAK